MRFWPTVGALLGAAGLASGVLSAPAAGALAVATFLGSRGSLGGMKVAYATAEPPEVHTQPYGAVSWDCEDKLDSPACCIEGEGVVFEPVDIDQKSGPYQDCQGWADGYLGLWAPWAIKGAEYQRPTVCVETNIQDECVRNETLCIPQAAAADIRDKLTKVGQEQRWGPTDGAIVARFEKRNTKYAGYQKVSFARIESKAEPDARSGWEIYFADGDASKVKDGQWRLPRKCYTWEEPTRAEVVGTAIGMIGSCVAGVGGLAGAFCGVKVCIDKVYFRERRNHAMSAVVATSPWNDAPPSYEMVVANDPAPSYETAVNLPPPPPPSPVPPPYAAI